MVALDCGSSEVRAWPTESEHKTHDDNYCLRQTKQQILSGSVTLIQSFDNLNFEM